MLKVTIFLPLLSTALLNGISTGEEFGMSALTDGTFDNTNISVIAPLSNPQSYIVVTGQELTSGHLRSFLVLLDRPYCMVSFQIWRQVNVNTGSDSWQLRYTTPVYTMPTQGVVKVDVRHEAFVVLSLDKLGFLDLSVTPCVTYHEHPDPAQYVQTSYFLHNGTLLTRDAVIRLTPYRTALDFNVRAEIEPYSPDLGIQGVVGPKGEIGVDGDQGYNGVYGDRGEQGDKGIFGEQGEKGRTGYKGLAGDRGDTGDQGIQAYDAFPGISGDRGVIGDVGDTGSQGVTGPKGTTGVRGAKGEEGDRGEQGYQGEYGESYDGITGLKGEQGDYGDEGYVGEIGDPGVRGDPGEQGIYYGLSGDPGEPGEAYNPFGYDWCAVSNLRCSHTCMNTESGAMCACPNGYTLSSDGQCEEVDECRTRNGMCQHTCENIPGSYVCTCYRGYTLSDDRHRCNDIDECQSNICGSEQICINIEGRHECVGPYTISGMVSGAMIQVQTTDPLLTVDTLAGITVWLCILTIIFIIEVILCLCIMWREHDATSRPIEVIRAEPEPESVYTMSKVPSLRPPARYFSLPRISYIDYKPDRRTDSRPVSVLDSVPYAQVHKLRRSRSASPL